MRPYYYNLLIDGHPILVPDAGITIEYTDIDAEESGRDESYYMHRIVVRRGVKKWPLVYSDLHREEYLYMESLFKDKDDFVVTYRDHDGQICECVCYRSKHSITLQNARTGDYRNYNFNIVES